MLEFVISSAGIAKLNALVDLPIAELQEHITVNSIGPLLLFKAVVPLLKKSSQPRFVLIGAAAGSVSMMETFPFPNASYSSSKLLAHYLVRKMHLENDWLIAFSIHPG